MSSESLINRHRPTKFKDIIGQDATVRSFKTALEDGTSHAFLFTGPSGCGKTSLARIGAAFLGVSHQNLIEIDGATNNSVDDMRSLTESLRYRPLGRNATKAVIIDECHAISKAAWQASLKMIEEPPKWLLWFLCTTEEKKVPDTINKMRCTSYKLNAVPPSTLLEFLDDICEKEKFDTPKGILDLCSKQANGSVRRALANLAKCYACVDRAEAAKLIADFEEEEGGDGFKLAQYLAAGRKWDAIQPVLAAIRDMDGSNPESVRHIVRQYYTSMALGTKDEAKVCTFLKILDNFSEPFNPDDGMTPLIIAVGRSMF